MQEALQSEKIRLVMQMRRNGITDMRVLGAMEAIPRELFVSRPFLDQAYADCPLPIEKDQTISQPTVVALMTQELKATDRHTVLEIGTGSGYQAAILAKLVRRVHTIERHRELHDMAKKRFEHLGLSNITTHMGDGALGWKHAAPYDRIMVTAAAVDVPPFLLEQLSPDGIMIIPLGPAADAQKLYRITKEGEMFAKTPLVDVRFVPLVEGA